MVNSLDYVKVFWHRHGPEHAAYTYGTLQRISEGLLILRTFSSFDCTEEQGELSLVAGY